MNTFFMQSRKMLVSSLLMLTMIVSALMSRQGNAAPMQFDFRSSNGQIGQVLIAQSNMVFKISASGRLDAIWLLSSAGHARTVVNSDHAPYYSSIKLPSSSHGVYSQNKTRLFTHSKVNRQNITYYRNAYDKQGGFYDTIKSINGTGIDYFRNSQNNKRNGLVGKVKRIGNININYHYGTGRDKGKVRSIGNTSFRYEPWSSSGKAAGYVGKLMSVGGIPIKYFEAYSTNKGYQGKIRSIGNVKVKYLNQFNIPHPPKDKFGQFDKLIGSDSRFNLFVH